MLLIFISLIVVFLIFRVILVAATQFMAWLGRGRMLDNIMAAPHISAENLNQIKAFALRCKDARTQRRRGLKIKQPRLTKKQKKTLSTLAHLAREQYLDVMRLNWYQLVVIFLVGSFAGLILEEVWMFITEGLTESRVGLVWGPFSPLYGFGAVFLTIICWKLRCYKASNWQIYLVSLVIGGLLEQATGWVMLHGFGLSSWTYAHLPDHITQWVAWRFLFAWGLIGLIWAKLIMPEVLFRIGVPTTIRQVVFVGLLALYLALDIFMTMSCFMRLAQRNAGIPPHNDFEEWIDHHYTDKFIEGRFQNMAIKGMK